MSAPLVLISTAKDPVPVIIESPFAGEQWGDEYRKATDDEYRRYYDHYTGGPGDPDGPWRDGVTHA